MHKKLLLFLFILMTMPAALFAQEPVMNVRSRQSAAAGQPFQITFEVNGKAANFKMPTFKNLTLVGGPSTGYSSSTSIINGQMTQSVTYTYTIIVQADNVGTANVGVASCTVDGKSVTSKPFSIKIEKPDPNRQQQQQQQAASSWPFGNPSRPQRQQQQQPAQQQPKTIDNNTLFARASINKSNLYQGEEAIIVYKIYTQVPLTQFQIDKLPRNKGFWSEDLSEGQTQVRQYTETYNGRQYQVAEIRRGALYPQETGRLNIAPLKTDVVAIVQTQAQRQRTGTILDF
ncbi:MAG: BatD family protein, partial [Bacteroidales bacterium]|nr:BatD family protein [Bacteroidales bacterium]